MTLPFTTTTVTIDRPSTAQGGGDAWVTPTWVSVASGVPANVTGPSGAERVGGGNVAERIDAVLHVAHTVDVQSGDRVIDAATGMAYAVTWVVTRIGFGLDHRRAGLKWTQGGV